MMYGSCGTDNPGNVRMRGNECSKHSAKALQDHTEVNLLSYQNIDAGIMVGDWKKVFQLGINQFY